MAALNLGALRHKCLIERKSVTQDSQFGTEIVTWVTVAETRCSIEDVPPSRAETVANNLAASSQRSIVQMRFRTDVDSSMRFTVNRPASVTYQIIAGPAEIGIREGVEFSVERYTS